MHSDVDIKTDEGGKERWKQNTKGLEMLECKTIEREF
jgi:hypothetical protein